MWVCVMNPRKGPIRAKNDVLGVRNGRFRVPNATIKTRKYVNEAETRRWDVEYQADPIKQQTQRYKKNSNTLKQNQKTIQNLSWLARLKLPAEREGKILNDLQSILDWVEQLKEVNVELIYGKNQSSSLNSASNSNNFLSSEGLFLNINDYPSKILQFKVNFLTSEKCKNLMEEYNTKAQKITNEIFLDLNKKN